MLDESSAPEGQPEITGQSVLSDDSQESPNYEREIAERDARIRELEEANKRNSQRISGYEGVYGRLKDVGVSDIDEALQLIQAGKAIQSAGGDPRKFVETFAPEQDDFTLTPDSIKSVVSEALTEREKQAEAQRMQELEQQRNAAIQSDMNRFDEAVSSIVGENASDEQRAFVSKALYSEYLSSVPEQGLPENTLSKAVESTKTLFEKAMNMSKGEELAKIGAAASSSKPVVTQSQGDMGTPKKGGSGEESGLTSDHDAEIAAHADALIRKFSRST